MECIKCGKKYSGNFSNFTCEACLNYKCEKCGTKIDAFRAQNYSLCKSCELKENKEKKQKYKGCRSDKKIF